MKYYVEIIAANYLKNVVPDPVTLEVHDKFLHGLTRDEFAEGFKALLSLVRKLYGDIADDPAGFGMPLKEIVDIYAKTPDYTNSNAGFIRAPHLLLIIGAISELCSDGTLTVDGGALTANAKILKITGLTALLAKLRDYGFDISDFGKALKAGELLSFVYVDNRYLTTALKSMADALLELTEGDLRNPKNNYFYMMNPALLASETVKEPKMTIDSVYHAISPVERDYAARLHNLADSVAKYKVRIGGFMRNDWSCVYTSKKSKKVLMSLQVEQNLSVKLNLQNIGRYISMVSDMPERIQGVFRSSGWDCAKCNPRCAGGFKYELDGKAYDKCHCGVFVFNKLTGDDVEYCEKLLREEIELQA